MAFKVIALDTSVVAFLCQTTPPKNTDSVGRWTAVHSNATRLFKEAGRIIIPAPVITELYAGGLDGEKIANLISARSSSLRICALDLDASRVAGNLLKDALTKRPEDLKRNALKFDSLIYAIAVTNLADAILTTDGSDFAKISTIKGIPGSKIQVIKMDLPLPGQLPPPKMEGGTNNVVKLRRQSIQLCPLLNSPTIATRTAFCGPSTGCAPRTAWNLRRPLSVSCDQA